MCSAPVHADSAQPLARIDKVSISFGGIRALREVSFDIPQGRIVGLIGPNGAGKTTLFNCISRLYHPSNGDIRVAGESILGCGPHEIIRRGIGRTFQNLALYPSLTVADNVLVGLHCRLPFGRAAEALGLASARRATAEAAARVHALLHDFGLGPVASRKIGELTYATQKRVEMARAIVSEPRLLLLDEPAGGLNQEEVHELADFIRMYCGQRAMAVLLVEHHLNLVMSISDKVVALDFGEKIADGTPREVQSCPRVQTAYLGSEDVALA